MWTLSPLFMSLGQKISNHSVQHYFSLLGCENSVKHNLRLRGAGRWGNKELRPMSSASSWSREFFFLAFIFCRYLAAGPRGDWYFGCHWQWLGDCHHFRFHSHAGVQICIQPMPKWESHEHGVSVNWEYVIAVKHNIYSFTLICYIVLNSRMPNLSRQEICDWLKNHAFTVVFVEMDYLRAPVKDVWLCAREIIHSMQIWDGKLWQRVDLELVKVEQKWEKAYLNKLTVQSKVRPRADASYLCQPCACSAGERVPSRTLAPVLHL